MGEMILEILFEEIMEIIAHALSSAALFDLAGCSGDFCLIPINIPIAFAPTRGASRNAGAPAFRALCGGWGCSSVAEILASEATEHLRNSLAYLRTG